MANQVSVPKVQTTDRNINQLQQNIITAINSLQTQVNTTSAQVTTATGAWNSQSSNYTILITDSSIGFTCSSQSLTATLPDASQISGQQFMIMKVDNGSGMLTLNTGNSQTIGRQKSVILYLMGDSITLQSDGSNYQIIIPIQKNKVQFKATFSSNGTGYTGGDNIYFDTVLWDTSPNLRQGYGYQANGVSGDYVIPSDGYYIVGYQGQQVSGSQIVSVRVNGTTPNGAPLAAYIQDTSSFNGLIIPGQTPVKCVAGDVITLVSDDSFTNNFIYEWIYQVA